MAAATVLLLGWGCSDDGGGGPSDAAGDRGPAEAGPAEGGALDTQRHDRAPGYPDGSGPQPDAIAPPVSCGGTAALALEEIATGQPDYLALRNLGTTPIDLAGFELAMTGIDPDIPVSYTFGTGTTLAGGQTIYVFEWNSGTAPDDINTGDNIPFYDDLESNSVALYDPTGNLLDFVAIGDAIVGLPKGAQVTLLAWPAGFDSSTDSFQRVGHLGKCPSFVASDWAAKPLTRP